MRWRRVCNTGPCNTRRRRYLPPVIDDRDAECGGIVGHSVGVGALAGDEERAPAIAMHAYSPPATGHTGDGDGTAMWGDGCVRSSQCRRVMLRQQRRGRVLSPYGAQRGRRREHAVHAVTRDYAPKVGGVRRTDLPVASSSIGTWAAEAELGVREGVPACPLTELGGGDLHMCSIGQRAPACPRRARLCSHSAAARRRCTCVPRPTRCQTPSSMSRRAPCA